MKATRCKINTGDLIVQAEKKIQTERDRYLLKFSRKWMDFGVQLDELDELDRITNASGIRILLQPHTLHRKHSSVIVKVPDY